MTCSLKLEMTYTSDRALRCLQNFYTKEGRHFPDVLASIHFLPHSSWQPLNLLSASTKEKVSYCCCVLSPFSCVPVCATLWTVACQAALSMGFSKARILEWVAMPSFGGSSWPRDPTFDVPCIFGITGGFFTTQPPRKSNLLTDYGQLKYTSEKKKNWIFPNAFLLFLS